MDYLANNWKTVLVGLVVGAVVLCLFFCNGESNEAPAVEEVPVEVVE